jgi:signal transduction histidine kinase
MNKTNRMRLLNSLVEKSFTDDDRKSLRKELDDLYSYMTPDLLWSALQIAHANGVLAATCEIQRHANGTKQHVEFLYNCIIGTAPARVITLQE